MKQILNNRYVKSFKFISSQEAWIFLNNHDTKNIILFEETLGKTYYCYVCYHSLTSEALFIIGFSSDEDEDNLNLLFWEENQLFVLDTGKFLYLIDDKLQHIASFDITTPLVGLYLTNKNRLLLLEEASLRLIDSSGEVVKSELFDLLEDFNIDNDLLSILTSEGKKVFELN